MLFGVITQKILAIFIGAEGIALVGNFRNVFNFFEQFSIFGTFNGLVKYISEYKNDKAELNNIISSALIFATISSIVSFLVLFFGSNFLNEFIFGVENNYGFIFIILAFFIPFMGVNAILNGVLNGLSEYKIYTKTMIITIVLSTILIVFLTIEYGLMGSIVAICLVPILQFLANILFYFKQFVENFSLVKFSFHNIYRNKLLSYSFMTLIVILLINCGDIIVRNLIQDTVSIKEAGHWTAMTSVSKIYMQFTAAIFPLYILPKYSGITSTVEFRKEILNIYKGLVPIFILGMVLVYLLKKTIILVLYTDDFLEMTSLFKYQLFGDLIKLCSLIISYQFLAKRQIGYFLFTESLSVILFVGFSGYFIEIYGTEGIVLAHFIRYLIYFIVVVFILRHKLSGRDKIL
jgi:PST family polysaccharide transporter